VGIRGLKNMYQSACIANVKGRNTQKHLTDIKQAGCVLGSFPEVVIADTSTYELLWP